ncbi:MAG: hypothetical protein IPN79_20080 [Saprospiraceae bacterium]|nr:hypothetical protein [Saprospiraceae bacterium]
MIIVVNDANVLIDLIKLDLTDHFFSLPLKFHTTDIILDELHDEQQETLKLQIDNGIFNILSLSSNDLMEMNNLQSQRPQLSIQDCSAIVCTKNISGELITSDNNLRNFAANLNLIVHGHLWVFDQLVNNLVLDPTDAIVKLNQLMDINPRLGLPNAEVTIRLNNWRNL